MAQRHCRIIACAFLIYMPAGVASAEDLNLSDLYSIAQQNARAPRTIRVSWRIEKGLSKQGKNFHAAAADGIAAAVRDGKLDPGKQDSFLSEAKFHREMADSSRHEYAFFDYWTDFTSFQMRAIRSLETGGAFSFTRPTAVHFPDQLPNGNDLAKSFEDIEVLSYGPGTDAMFRFWQATRQAPFLARVGLNSAWFDDWHVPLVLPPPTWEGKLHPIDEFFALLANGRGHVIGIVELHEKPLCLVFVSNGQLSMRAFMDLDAGAIPRRLERFPWDVTAEQGSDFPGPCEQHPNLTAQVVVRDIDIGTFKAGEQPYFYPVSGVVCNLSKAASVADAVSAVQPEMAVHDTTAWHVELVECNRAMDATDFRLTFPPNTVYVDDAQRESFVTGDIEGQVARIADTAINFSSAGKSWWKSWAVVCVGILVIGASAYWLRRRF